jgi:heme/copper-type cytochrome/quinol oxidase subunit 2
MEILITLTPLVIIVGLGFLILSLFQEMKSQKPSTNNRNPQKQFTQPKTTTSVDNYTQSQLISMLQGDRDACQRLITVARRQYPGKSEQWYWERAIEDLIRDRR